jgi:hypothetical protein
MHMSSHEQQSRGANLHHRWRNLTSTRILKGCNTMVSRMAVGRGPVVTKNLGRVSVSDARYRQELGSYPLLVLVPNPNFQLAFQLFSEQSKGTMLSVLA